MSRITLLGKIYRAEKMPTKIPFPQIALEG